MPIYKKNITDINKRILKFIVNQTEIDFVYNLLYQHIGYIVLKRLPTLTSSTNSHYGAIFSSSVTSLGKQSSMDFCREGCID